MRRGGGLLGPFHRTGKRDRRLLRARVRELQHDQLVGGAGAPLHPELLRRDPRARPPEAHASLRARRFDRRAGASRLGCRPLRQADGGGAAQAGPLRQGGRAEQGRLPSQRDPVQGSDIDDDDDDYDEFDSFRVQRTFLDQRAVR
eukprot:3990843-Pyramimonas_sp.AAC.1